MVGNKTPHWQGIEMLPVIYELVEQELDAAEEQLNNLQEAKEKPYVLDDHTVERLLKLYGEKLSQNPLLCEQCQRWHQTPYLSERQKDMIASLKQHLVALEKTTQKILFLANHFYQHTIDKIFAKEDVKLVQDMVSGQAYIPEPLDEIVNEAKEAAKLLTTQQKEVIVTIHEKMLAIQEQGGNEADMLTSMLEEMPIVKTLFQIDEKALNVYCSLYPGFHAYMSLLEELAEAAATGDIAAPVTGG